jgi:hypothetical protein
MCATIDVEVRALLPFLKKKKIRWQDLVGREKDIILDSRQ